MNLAVFERMPRPGRATGRWGYLGNAFVLAPYRDQGIGSQLLAAVLGYAREHDFAAWCSARPRGRSRSTSAPGSWQADVLMVWVPPDRG